MTVRRDLKSIVRERQRRTGESYTAAHAHVMRERAQLLGIADAPAAAPEPVRVEAAVLKVGSSTARIRILGEDRQVTFRSKEVSRLAPGHVATVTIARRWEHRGDAYASGTIDGARIDVDKLGLAPLPLEGGDLEDLRERYERVRAPDPYAPLWRKLTATPRPTFEMDGIMWGSFPDDDPDENPTCEAVELREAGDLEGATALLMDTLLRDLRCLDAHAQLGNLAFEVSPARAMVHYEIGVRIGELSLPHGFDGVLPWSALHNRPFLRCLHGYALCHWRLGRTDLAIQAFERILALNPNDNQGARFCWSDARLGVTWDEAQARDELEESKREEAARKLRAKRARQHGRSAGPAVN